MEDDSPSEEIKPSFTAGPDDPVAPPEPKRRGRPPGSGTGTRGRPRRKRDLTEQVQMYLHMLNMAFQFMPDPLRGDALDDMEIHALAVSLNAYAQANATAYKYLDSILVQGGASFNLLLTIGIIAGRRAARHGVIPEDMDAQLGGLLASGIVG
jgi:hypothetical protein